MILIGQSEILYCIKDGLSVKIESAEFTKDAKEETVAAFDGKGLNVFIFTFHKGFLHFMDD